MISSWTTGRSCFTQLQVQYLHSMMTKGTCTVRFLPSSTRTPISFKTVYKPINTEDLPIFGTLVVAGATADHIKVLIPDTFSGPTVNADTPVVLQHVVGLTLGPAVDLSSSLPSPDLDRALCRNSVLPTLTKRRRSYWAEVNPILRMWQHVNDVKCPVCDGLIRVNMSRHL